MSFLPSELITNGIDAYLANHTTKSQQIYWVVLVATIVTLIALPFIHVDISVQDAGVIRPAAEKTEIKASITEFVDSVFTREGSPVNRGDTILTFRTDASDYKINYQQSRLTDLQEHLHDLRYLTDGNRPDVFHSGTRRQEYLYFQKQQTEYQTALEKATKDYERHKLLFERDIIPEEEYEKYEFEYTKAHNQLASLRDNQLSQWQTDMNTYDNSYGEMLSNLKLEEKDRELYAVTSPVSGTLEHFRGIYKGSNIQAGAPVAIVSPDSTLFMEVYALPRHIGYIREGMPVNIQIESFNYNEWGMIEGQVVDISSDFFTDDMTNGGGAYYKVKCSMANDYVVHRKGMKGYLKKGMTVSAHFMITRRSLFDLLYQRMDDWINPTQYNGE